jgi:UDP-N-acetyl-D-glucosamine dehydrogenase
MPATSTFRPTTYAVTKRFIEDRTARLGVIGLGRVGLQLAMNLVQAGFLVLGFDSDPERVSRLLPRSTYFWRVNRDASRATQRNRCCGTCDFSQISETDVLVLCLPIVHLENSDIRLVRETVFTVASRLHSGQLIVIESPADSAMAEEIVIPILESANDAHLRVSRNTGALNEIFVGISPNAEASSLPFAELFNPGKLVGGADTLGMELTAQLYSTIFKEVISVPCPSRTQVAALRQWVNTHHVDDSILFDKIGRFFGPAGLGISAFTSDESLPTGFGGNRNDVTSVCSVPIDPFYFSGKRAMLGFCSGRET